MMNYLKISYEAENVTLSPLVFNIILNVLAVARVCMLSFFSHVQLFVTLLTVVHQAPLSVGFFSQEC